MSVFNFMATHALIDGVSPNQTYSIETAIEQFAPLNTSEQERFVPIDGATEVHELSRRRFFSVKTDWVEKPDWPKFEMMMQSILGGALFTFDEHGSLEIPLPAIICQATFSQYKPRAVSPLLRTYTLEFQQVDV